MADINSVSILTDGARTIVTPSPSTPPPSLRAARVALNPINNLSALDAQSAFAEHQSDLDALQALSHPAVTLGTANGLSLVGQQLSMGEASPSQAGVISTAAQAFAGLKTFQNGLIVSLPTAGASDISIKLGTTVVSGSVAQGFRALSLRSGIGGTETEFAYFSPNPVPYNGVLTFPVAPPTNIPAILIASGTGWSGMIGWDGGPAGGSLVGVYNGTTMEMSTTNRHVSIWANKDAFVPAGEPHVKLWSYPPVTSRTQVRIGGGQAGPTDKVVEIGTSVADASVDAAARLLTVKTGLGGTEVEKFYVAGNGRMVNVGGLSVTGRAGADIAEFWTSTPIKAVAVQPSGTLYAALGINTAGSNLTVGGTGQIEAGTGGVGVSASSFALNLWAGWGLTDAAATEAIILASNTAFTASGAAIAAFKNGGTGSATKSKIDKDGQLEVLGAGLGIILKSPNGTRYRVTVNDAGSLQTTLA